MNLIRAFVENPVKVSVAVLLLVLFGFVAVGRMPLQLTPEVQTPTLTIETRWPGASPQEIEREIVQEQEEQLKGVEGVVKMSSESQDSSGRITLEFTVTQNMDEALLLVNSRLQQVREYPEDADQPVISTSNSNDRPIAWLVLNNIPPPREKIEAYAKQHPTLSKYLEPVLRAHNNGLMVRRLKLAAAQHPQLQELIPPQQEVPDLRRFAEDQIESRLERVEGVSNSNVLGGRTDELQVIVDPQKLAARQITYDDLRRVLQQRNNDRSGGDFWEGKRRWVVRTLGRFTKPGDIENLIVAKPNGLPVYVRDVAEVKLSHGKPQGGVFRFGEQSIAVNCMRESGANVLDVMAGIREVVKDLNENILNPRGLQLTQVYDETEYIYSALDLVKGNILLGGTLTVISLLLFLRSMRSTLVIALAIPTSIIGTFLIMDLMGRSLNVISLAGLAFAVGMLVDNAVVVLENIYRHYQMGKHRVQSAIEGTQEVWGAVVASTLTTLAVFLPVLFLEEETGQLFRDIAIAISGAVFLSLVMSVVVIPTAAARVLRKHHAREGKGSQPKFVRWLLAPFDWIGTATVATGVGINRFIQRGVMRQLAVIALLAGGAVFVAVKLLPKLEYLPTGNRNLVFGIILPPPGYNLEQLEEIGQTIEKQLQPYWDIDPGSPEFARMKEPAIGDFFYVVRNRQVFLGLRAYDPQRAGELIPVVRKGTAGIPGIIAVAKQTSLFEQGLTSGRTVDVEIMGPELPKLVSIGGQVMRKVGEIIPNAQALPRPSLDLSSPEVHVIPKWEQASDMEVNAAELGYAVDALVDGAYAADYYLEGDKIDLRISGTSDYTGRTQNIEKLPIATAAGNLVPLGAVANVEMRSGPEQINRRERERAITVQVSPPPEVSLEEAMERINSEIVGPLQAQGQLKGGYRIVLSGTADKLGATWRALRFNLMLALLITYLLMAALFESWLYPFVIILSVPLGAVGGLAGLKLLNFGLEPFGIIQPLDVLTMLGFIILIGTVVNNPILIVHQSLNHMREEEMDVGPAILESVRTRLRPIFMTTGSTIFGLLPLVIMPGSGSELYRGIGAVVLGGLLVSTVFTVFLVPAVFYLTLRMKLGIVRALDRTASVEPQPGTAT